MKLRWKLLVLILVVGLLPIVFTRGYVQEHVGEMSREMAGKMREVLLDRTRAELLLRVEAHAESLMMAEGILKLILQLQVSQLESRLAAESLGGPVAGAGFGKGPDPKWESGLRCRYRGDGTCRPLDIAFNAVRVWNGGGEFPDQARLLRSMLPVYQSVNRDFPELIVWQMTVFNSGTTGLYPAVDHIPMMFHPRRTEWFKHAAESEGPVWTLAGPDPITRSMVMNYSQAFRGADGRVAGVTGVKVLVNSVLEGGALEELSKNLVALLVHLDPRELWGKSGVVVLARESRDGGMRGHFWMQETEPELLEVEEADGVEKMVADLKASKSGVRRMRYRGMDSFWAYAPLGESMTAVLLIVPTADVSGPADEAGAYIKSMIADQVQRSLSFMVVTLVITLLVGWFVTKAVTRNIGALVAAVRRVGTGDFSARADFSSRDEIGELGRAFNQMIPALEDRLKMRQSLSVAKEVQNNLLPGEHPNVAGLDIAGASIYCEATGGDYFDYFGRSEFSEGRVGILVGDVTGHGVPAALMMASARAYLRLRTCLSGDTARAVAEVNKRLFRDSGMSGRFMTLFCGIVDAPDHKLRWVRAGHDPAVLYNPKTDEFKELMGDGLPLGAMDEDLYVENEISLESGIVFAVGTDGIWETVNEDNEMFGRERFKEILRQESSQSAEDILTAVIEAVDAFRGNLKQRDDVTLVVVKVQDATV